MGSAGSSHEAASCGMLRKACLMEAGENERLGLTRQKVKRTVGPN